MKKAKASKQKLKIKNSHKNFDKRWNAKFGDGDKISTALEFFKEFEEMRKFK